MNRSSAGARALLFGVSSIALAAAGALAPSHAQSTLVLDAITVLATKTPERTIDSLAAVSSVQSEEIQRTQPSRLSDVFVGMPGVSFRWIAATIRQRPSTCADCRISAASPC
jgi:hemoglobin/transferrin/lactoferrin receptor protein